MSLFYFHLRDGVDRLLDPDGRDLPSLDAVATATLEEARGVIGHDALEGRVKLTYHIDVENADGQLVHRLDFEDAVEVIRRAANG